jgi:hypothetical protein
MKRTYLVIILILLSFAGWTETPEVTPDVHPLTYQGREGFWISEEDFTWIDKALNYLFLLDDEYQDVLDANEQLLDVNLKQEEHIDRQDRKIASLSTQRNICVGMGLGLLTVAVLGGLFLW